MYHVAEILMALRTPPCSYPGYAGFCLAVIAIGAEDVLCLCDVVHASCVSLLTSKNLYSDGMVSQKRQVSPLGVPFEFVALTFPLRESCRALIDVPILRSSPYKSHVQCHAEAQQLSDYGVECCRFRRLPL